MTASAAPGEGTLVREARNMLDASAMAGAGGDLPGVHGGTASVCDDTGHGRLVFAG